METWLTVLGLGITVIIAATGGALKLFANAHPRRKLRDIGEAAEVLSSLDPSSPAHVAVSGYLNHQVFLLELSNSRRQVPLTAPPTRFGMMLVWIAVANGVTFGTLLLAIPETRDMPPIQLIIIGIAVTGVVAIVADGYHSIQALRGGAPWRSLD
jgi:hypothetical protein